MSAPSGDYCLVRFGTAGFLGYFRLADPDVVAERGDMVVIRSARGVELGEVLRRDASDLGLVMAPTGRSPGSASEAPSLAGGTVLRRATAADQARTAALAGPCSELLACAESLCHEQNLPILVVDAEAVLEPVTFVLHLLRLGQVDERPLVAALSRQFQALVRVHDLTASAAADGDTCGICGAGSCGSGGCGSGGCQTGCASGCGTQAPAEFERQWREYFAVLREQMERRRPLPMAG